MPSRLTAPKEEFSKRKYALQQANKNKAISNYHGIRVNRKGELFIIQNACIWTIWDEEGSPCGQAATFDSWKRI